MKKSLEPSHFVRALITRKEFLTLPMSLRRKILSRATDELIKASRVQGTMCDATKVDPPFLAANSTN